jgi:L-lactate dehydrogenase
LADATAHPTRIAIVGAGNVGATFGFSLVLSGLAAEIVLVDSNRARAEGEAMDLMHAVPFGRPSRVWAGSYDDCAGAAITVISAGAAQREGQTRLDLVRKNDKIFSEIVPAVAAANPEGVILVATNPVDVLTYRSLRYSGLAPNRVIGSGTILDTARFRALLSERFGIDPRSVHAFIAGEHGDSEVPLWSSAHIGGMRIDEFCTAHGLDFPADEQRDLFERTRDAAYAIIGRKGATYYAVAAGLLRIVEAILRDQRTVLPVSSLIDGYHGIRDVCLSLPTVVGRNGVEMVLRVGLSDEEEAGLRHSAGVLRSTLDALDDAVPSEATTR